MLYRSLWTVSYTHLLRGILLDRKYTHSPANGICYAAIRCFTKEPRRGDNYFTLFTVLTLQNRK